MRRVTTGTITVTVIDVAPDTLALHCGSGSVQLVVGEVIDLACRQDARFSIYSSDSLVVTQTSFARFRASAVGTARVVLVTKHTCQMPGCPEPTQRIFLDVKVIPAPGTFAAAGRMPISVGPSAPTSTSSSSASLEAPCNAVAVTMDLGQSLSLPCDVTVGHSNHAADVNGDTGVLVRRGGAFVASKPGVALLSSDGGCGGGASCGTQAPTVVTVVMTGTSVVRTCNDGHVRLPFGAALDVSDSQGSAPLMLAGAALRQDGSRLIATRLGDTTVTLPLTDPCPALSPAQRAR